MTKGGALVAIAMACTACHGGTLRSESPGGRARLDGSGGAAADDAAADAGADDTAQRPTVQPDRAADSVAVDAATARTRGREVFMHFVDKVYSDPQLDPGGDVPKCEDGKCEYTFSASAAYQGERMALARVHVDAASGVVMYEPNDGKDKRWAPDAYAAYLAGSEKAIEAALAIPEVKRYCAALEKRGTRCLSWIDESSDVPCPDAPDLLHECLWTVYLGENQQTHSVRFATLAIVPQKWAVIGASTMECEIMPLAAFKKYMRAITNRPSQLPKCSAR